MRSTKQGLAGFALLAVLTGCGTAAATTTAADRVPALGDRLERIDAAIVAHRYEAARAALRRLIAETTAATESGALSAEEADRIIAAARTLLTGLPRPQQQDEPEKDPSPTERPSERATPTGSATPTESPTSEAPEPSVSPSGPTVEPSPSEEPAAEPSREATPTEQTSPAAAG